MVFYTLGKPKPEGIFDAGFKQNITWDLPLLENYNYTFIENLAKEPGHSFKGIRNPTLIASIKAFKPDVILIYGWAYQSHLKVMRYFNGKVPIWFRGDSTLLDKSYWLRELIKKIFLTWVYKHVEIAYYVGTKNKEYFKKYGLKENQLIFAPHAIDNDRFGEDRSLGAVSLRNDLNIQDGEQLILFAGKFEEKKAPMLLLDAFIELDNVCTHLLFVGNGKLEESLKFKMLSSKSRNIHFMDFQNQTQMPVIYQACDLFCLPSKGPGETWGLAVNEAMAAGKAILVSDQVGCGRDLILQAENGFIFKNMDLKDLVSKLEILTKGQTLKLFGKRSKEIIHCWSFFKQAKIITEKIYEGFR